MKRRVTVKSDTFVIIVILLLLCLIGIRTFFVALAPKVDGVDLTSFADNRNTKSKTLYATRGGIYDYYGDALALSANSYTLIAYLSSSRTTNINNPQHVVDKKYTAKMLATVINLSEEKILTYLNKDAYQVEFGSQGKGLTETTKKKIESLELPGIDFIESVQRYYKMGNFASYLIGYAKTYDDGSINGELGIEGYLNDTLSGENGKTTYETDLYGYKLPYANEVTEEATNGSDVYLTIDSNVQLICEDAVKSLTKNYESDWMILTIMDAKTGAILASSTYPSFNPNDLNTIHSYLNPLVSYAYEPGSTMKIFSWGSAMEEGIYEGEKEYKSGYIILDDETKISDFNKEGWGYITYDKGFAYSSNVAATNLALQMGKDTLKNYYSLFGFGKKTGIELSGELAGTLDFTYQSEIANAGFGQGISVTAIQLLQALTSLANDGKMLKPYVVDRIIDENGVVTYKASTTVVDTVFSKETTSKLLELMYDVNYNGLTKMWRPDNVTMAIKTGTAQIAEKGKYLDGTYDKIYSVAGLFPYDDPQYIVYAAVKKLHGTQKNFADVVVGAVEEIASYLNATDEKEIEISKIVNLKNMASMKTKDAISDLKDDFDVITLGTGNYVISQYPKASSNVVKGSKVFLITNNDDYVMPNIIGWSLSEVKTLCYYLGIDLDYSGYGYVKSQSIKENQELSDTLTIKLG